MTRIIVSFQVVWYHSMYIFGMLYCILRIIRGAYVRSPSIINLRTFHNFTVDLILFCWVNKNTNEHSAWTTDKYANYIKRNKETTRMQL